MDNQLDEQINQPEEQITQKPKMELGLFVTPLLVGVFCGCALIASEAMFYSPLDVALLGVIVPIVMFASSSIVFGSTLLAVGMLPFLLFKKQRLLATRCLISALCLALPVLLAWKFAPTETFRISHIQLIERNGEPLIEAIKKFSDDKGRPPENLQALVPSYIDKLPATGESRNRNFGYKVSENTNDAPWEIGLDYGIPLVGSPDRLIYNPTEDYSVDKTRKIEHFGKWALVQGRL